MHDEIRKMLRRSHSTLIKSSFGLLFPQVYRIIPYPWESLDLKAPSKTPQEPYYSFDEEGSNLGGWAKVVATPIKGLDSAADKGLLFVRHHATGDEASGYYEGLKDFYLWSDQAEHDLSFAVTQTEQGFFTLHRRLTKLPRHNRLAIYVGIHPDAEKPGYFGDIDEFQIVMPDGSVSTDSNQLYEDLGNED